MHTGVRNVACRYLTILSITRNQICHEKGDIFWIPVRQFWVSILFVNAVDQASYTVVGHTHVKWNIYIYIFLSHVTISVFTVISLSTHWGRNKMAAIFSDDVFKCILAWMKMHEFRLRFHWGLFLKVQLTIFQHWFRYCLGTDQATSHYLNY